MTNEKLLSLMKEFVDQQDSSSFGDMYSTDYETVSSIMSNFVTFLNAKGIRIDGSSFGDGGY